MNLNSNDIKVIHFSMLDYGGAGFASYKFHKNLIKHGYKSTLFVQNKRTMDGDVIELKANKFHLLFNKILKVFENLFGSFNSKYIFYDRGRYSVQNINQIVNELKYEPNIIILESISRFIDLKTVNELQKKFNAKVFWYIYDMAPITGGCHFSWDCKEYENGCEICPAVKFLYKDFPGRNLENKKKYLSKLNYEMLITVRWMKNRLNKSLIYNSTPCHFLTVGFNERIFCPGEKNKLRIKRNIPVDKKVIFFGALNTTEERKGYTYLIKALDYYQNNYEVDNIILVTAGHKKVSLYDENISIDHYHLGYLDGDEELSAAYKLSDVFVSPVLEDIGPAMIMESMLCGTAVVAFNAGVALDLVKTNETGYLAKFKDYRDLAKGIMSVLNLNELEYTMISENCRKIALVDHTEKCQIKQFNEIIKGL